jgi:hypothetical protein
MAYLIMASSDTDALPPWLRPFTRALRWLFLRRFLAAVRTDPEPYLARVAAYRMEDPNVRPSEAARLRRLSRRRPARGGDRRAR